MGRGGPGIVSSDRVLVHQGLGGFGWQESVHCQSRRRFRISDRAISLDKAIWFAELRSGFPECYSDGPQDGWSWAAYRSRAAADGWGRGQVGTDSTLCMAARCDGRP